MITKKQGIILIILILLLAAAIWAYKIQFQNWPWERREIIQSPSATPTPTATSDGENREPRDLVMEDVAARISEISPEGPVLGGKWQVLRYWFVDGSYASVYVEYEDGHIMKKVLLLADLSKMPEISYKVEAVFEPGESDWVLKSGKDQKSGLPLILFEYDETAGRWAQKN